MHERSEVLVVGAGIVGAACALELARAGCKVHVVDAAPRWGAGCSTGNAGLITPSRSLPLASSSNIRDGLRSLVNSDQSFRIRPHSSLSRWMPKYIAASLGRGSLLRRALLLRMGLFSAEIYRELDNLGFTSAITNGLLHSYTQPASLMKALEIAQLDMDAGLQIDILNADQAREFEPALNDKTVGALLYSDDSYCDPLAMTASLGSAAEGAGAMFSREVEVLGWRGSKGRVESAVTTEGEVKADVFVLAAGSASARLSRLAGSPLLIEPGKGYSIDVRNNYVRPGRAILLPEDHCVVTPLGDYTRMTSKLELAGQNYDVSQKTVDGILKIAANALRTEGQPTVEKVWRGMRPCSPDGLPYIGRMAPVQNLLAATGHGMLGVTLAPLTGKWIADTIMGRDADNSVELECVAPNRSQRSLQLQ